MKKSAILAICLSLIVFLAGCSSANNEVATEPSAEPGKEVVAEPKKDLAAKDYLEELKTAGLPIGEYTDYNEETDPNNLLGRPNQYTSKVNFDDTRLEKLEVEENKGGSIEVFPTPEGAKGRKEYIDSLGANVSFLAEYSYINGSTLLRLENDLTPTQAKEYEAAFMAIAQ